MILSALSGETPVEPPLAYPGNPLHLRFAATPLQKPGNKFLHSALGWIFQYALLKSAHGKHGRSSIRSGTNDEGEYKRERWIMNAADNWNNLKGDPRLIRMKELEDRVAELAAKAKLDSAQFPALADREWLERVIRRVSATFTLIVIGQVSSGKSSFINSLLGRKLLLPSDRPTDGVISALETASEGSPEYAEKVLRDGSVERFDSMDKAKCFLRQQETAPEEQLLCREVRFYLQEPWLKQLRIVNTPGLGDRLQQFENAALQYLHEDESDLVVWTFFPDSAANSAELGVFADALSRRRKSVVGIVTRCFEGKEHLPDYDPGDDPEFVGDTGVVPWLRKNLGFYLSDIVLYDSHLARHLVHQMRDEPGLQCCTLRIILITFC